MRLINTRWSLIDDVKRKRRHGNRMRMTVFSSAAWDVPHFAVKIEFTAYHTADFPNSLSGHQAELYHSSDLWPKLIQSLPQSPNFIIRQNSGPWLGDRRTFHSINRIMIEVAPGYAPSDHSSNILKHSPGCYRRIQELRINHSGNVSPMQLVELDMTYDWKCVLAQPALNLPD